MRLTALSVALMAAVSLVPGCASRMPGDRAAEDGPVMARRSQMLMGTVVSVTAVAADQATAERAAAAGLDEIRRLEELWSTWIPTSEVSTVNARAGRDAVPVSAETYALIQHALDIGRLTQGGFNVVIGPAVNVWGFPERPRLPSREELDAVRPLLDPAGVVLDPSARTIFLTRPGMALDVGGIGKGYAADLAAERMQRAGATGVVVALSGDIKTLGRMPDGEAFRFGIAHPRREGEVLGTLLLEDEAVSTAGDYQRYFMNNDVLYHHILDPRTLEPARASQSVTVVATDGVMADGLDTGIFVMGPKAGMELVEALKGVEAVIVDREGTVHLSSGLRGRVVLTRPGPSAAGP